MIHDALVSPGCTRAEMNTCGRPAAPGGSPGKPFAAPCVPCSGAMCSDSESKQRAFSGVSDTVRLGGRLLVVLLPLPPLPTQPWTSAVMVRRSTSLPPGVWHSLSRRICRARAGSAVRVARWAWLCGVCFNNSTCSYDIAISDIQDESMQELSWKNPPVVQSRGRGSSGQGTQGRHRPETPLRN